MLSYSAAPGVGFCACSPSADSLRALLAASGCSAFARLLTMTRLIAEGMEFGISCWRELSRPQGLPGGGGETSAGRGGWTPVGSPHPTSPGKRTYKLPEVCTLAMRLQLTSIRFVLSRVFPKHTVPFRAPQVFSLLTPLKAMFTPHTAS